ncbi:MAG: D-alanyl-D-alanine carboxypeptidase family protein [Pontixanthobacter sp.]
MKWVFRLIAITGLMTGTSAFAQFDPDAEHLVRDAQIAMMIDGDTGQVLFAKDANRRFIPASITKIMTAFLAFEMIKSGELRFDQKFALSKGAADDWYRTGSTMFLIPRELTTVDDLLKGIASVSANDGSAALAEGAAGSIDAWTARMNEMARRIGMRDSHFGTPNGWPDAGGTFTTASDLMRLSRLLIQRHPYLYSRYFGRNGMRHNGFAQANHDPISGIVEGADGIKTGYTRQAGHGFVGSAKRAGQRLIMVVAGVDGSPARTQASRDFMEWGFAAFERKSVLRKADIVAYAKVQNGASSSVGLQPRDDVSLALSKGQSGDVRGSVRYAGPLEAPLDAGQSVATLELRQGGKTLASIPLVASDNVAEAGVGQRITNAFREWVE